MNASMMIGEYSGNKQHNQVIMLLKFIILLYWKRIEIIVILFTLNIICKYYIVNIEHAFEDDYSLRWLQSK